jgi:ABC-type sugar transport system ATPase subunit
MSEYILEMVDISKEFPGVKALDEVNLKVRTGEIHALVGENGAGKSTLMKVLSGVHPQGSFQGQILVDGEEQFYRGINDSEESGVAVIYQELALVKQMDICENIFLGNEIKGSLGIDWSESYAKARDLLETVHLDVPPETKIVNLGIGAQQLVEIAKALSKDIKILVLDEPTAALNESESANLLNIIRKLKKQGVTCIYISHKLEEVLEIADSVTVLRDGKTIETRIVSEGEKITEDEIISMMVGRTLTQRFPRVEHTSSDVLMEVRNWTVYNPELPDKKIIDDVSFEVRRGEILGIAGLMGAGRTELATSLFGAYGIKKQGQIVMEGIEVNIRSPQEAILKGLSYVTEDRKSQGLVLNMDIIENSTLASHFRLSKGNVINKLEEILITNKYVKQLHVKTPSLEQRVNNLSGGNQQKVILGKWLMTQPTVLILDEPTRGIDVGAKFEIYNIMNELVEQGVGIVMISSELPEILGMSDRILVMHEGKFNGELDWQEASQEKIMHLATGGE